MYNTRLIGTVGTKFATLVVVFFGSIGFANAQITKTFSTNAQSQTREGERIGCTIIFDGATQDWLYSKGALVAISGSVSFNGYGSDGSVSPAVFVKLVTNDVEQSKHPIVLTPRAPSFVVPLGIGGKSTREYFFQTVESDTAGAWLGIYRLEALDTVLERISTANELAFAFNRQPGGSDLQFTVDLSIGPNGIDTGTNTKTNFVNCVREIVKDLQSKLKK